MKSKTLILVGSSFILILIGIVFFFDFGKGENLESSSISPEPSKRVLKKDKTEVSLSNRLLDGGRNKSFFEYSEVAPLDKEKWLEIKEVFVSKHRAREAPSKEINNPLEGLLQIMAQNSLPLTRHGYELVSKTEGHFLYAKRIHSDFSSGYAVREKDGKVFIWDLSLE